MKNQARYKRNVYINFTNVYINFKIFNFIFKYNYILKCVVE